MVFSYTVAVGDDDTDGIAIVADKLALNEGTIEDAHGNSATLTHDAVAANTGHKVDAVGPTVRLSATARGLLQSKTIFRVT